MEADPREQQNLVLERPQLRALLERRLKAVMSVRLAPAADAQEVTLSPEDLAELRRLGYF